MNIFLCFILVSLEFKQCTQRERAGVREDDIYALREPLFFKKKKVSCLPPIKLIINFINVFFCLFRYH